MKKVSFEYIASGDNECFTFAVDEETFKKIIGKDPDEFDKNKFHKNLYDIHPGEIFESIELRNKKFKCSILVDEV